MITLKRYNAVRISTGETVTLLYLKVAQQEATAQEFKNISNEVEA
jgi:hypothetical protein